MRWTRILRVGGGPKTPTGIVQDGPPQGGFPAVKVGRSLPGGGMSSIAMAAGCVLTFSFGMYKIIMANRFRREISREEMDIKLAVLPFLSAESDVKLAYIKAKQVENEAELMASVPNWDAGAEVYNTRFMNPMSVFGMHR